MSGPTGESPRHFAVAEPAEDARTIAAQAAELAGMAKHHGFTTLGYLLEMAQMEAEQIARARD